MLTPSYLLHAPEAAEEIAEQLHIDILNRIIERVLIRFERGDSYMLTALDKWQIETLQQAGFLLEDIQAEIAKAVEKMQTEVAEAMEDAGVRTLEYDDAIYRQAGIDPVPLVQSPALIAIMQRAYEATLGEWKNFTRTTATASQQTFIRVCDKAYNLAITGTISTAQAVREGLNELVTEGVTVKWTRINPKTGEEEVYHTDSIETATARAVRTGIAQASGQIQLARMDEFEWDLVLVSSHLGARPSHFVWQGKVYSRTGTGYPDFVSSTGYGTVTGLNGANCRHGISPWIEGMENPFEDYDSEENRKQYEMEQRQRTLERRIRDTKRQTMGWKTAVDKAPDDATRAEAEREYQRKAALLQKQNKAYNAYCEENGLKRRSERIHIAQWDRQQANAARAAAKKHQTEIEKQKQHDKMVEEIKAVGGFSKNAVIHIPPEEVLVKKLSFDEEHINKERGHNVSREIAEMWIRNSRMSVTVWNGRYERYYGTDGAVYVDWLENKIRTAYSGEEYGEKTLKLLEVLEKYGY